MEQLTKKGVEFVSRKENIDTTTPTGKFMLTIIAIAKEKGIYKGRQRIVRPEFESVVKLWRGGKMTAVEAIRRLDMTPSTFYRRVKALKL